MTVAFLSVPVVIVATGALLARALAHRPVPAAAAVPGPVPSVERPVWFRSARELYRTVEGVVDDLDLCLLAVPADPDGPADPSAARALLGGAVTRARGATSWAATLGDEARAPEAERACTRLSARLECLAEAGRSALADPADAERVRRLDRERERTRREARRLVRLL